MQCETNVWGLRPGRAARSARHARRVGGWAAAREDAGCGRRALGGRWLVAGASCCERCGRRASPVRRRRQYKWAANAATASVPCVATAPMQVGRQCGDGERPLCGDGADASGLPMRRRRASPVWRRRQRKWAANAASSLMWAAPSTQWHSQCSGTPITPLSLIMNPRSRLRRCCID